MLNTENATLHTLLDFIITPTPSAWLDYATENLPLLLIDHAHCERKAAATAINFISKYPEHAELVKVMSPLAREEMLHFEKVIGIMAKYSVDFCPLTPSTYAQTLHKEVTKRDGKERLRDQLLIGAIIEARSCERFYALTPLLKDKELSRFYSSLVKSESRHFEDYLRLARLYGGEIEPRLSHLLSIENELIRKHDTVFRFHSGILVSN